MQSLSSRIWTRIVVSNSYDDNHYTTGSLMAVIAFADSNTTFRKLKCIKLKEGSTLGVVANMLDYDIVLSEFELPSR